MLDRYEGVLNLALLRPLATVLGIIGVFVAEPGALSAGGQVLLPAHRSRASSSSTSRRLPARAWS